MKHIRRTLTFAIFSFGLMACEGPLGIFPGGELSGTVTEPPAIWQFEEISDMAQLETQPDDPYSINLVYVQIDGQLYVYAGNTRTTWVQHIESNPLVRIKIGETIYPLSAVRVHDDNEFNAFADIWASRSAFQRDPKQFDEVWLYRLIAR